MLDRSLWRVTTYGKLGNGVLQLIQALDLMPIQIQFVREAHPLSGLSSVIVCAR